MTAVDDDLAPPDGPPDLRVQAARKGCYWHLTGWTRIAAIENDLSYYGHAPTPGDAVADGLAALRRVRP